MQVLCVFICMFFFILFGPWVVVKVAIYLQCSKQTSSFFRFLPLIDFSRSCESSIRCCNLKLRETKTDIIFIEHKCKQQQWSCPNTNFQAEPHISLEESTRIKVDIVAALKDISRLS
ncbi:hypothetical protein HAX54_030935 [Datura stramonium]|uniref:Secreted protein n=1 Tax=Datura stramonium TaxID=4076 RepID=A0ABS8SBL5_DATST|nr:hypothetical protein [Datura stramonium]